MSSIQKRPHAGASNRKQKKLKAYHCAKERSGNKSSACIQPDMAGIMVTCVRGREGKATKEIFDVFNEYADKLYPATAITNENEGDKSDDDKDDLESAIAKEVEAMKSNRGPKRFASIPTNTDCILFIKVKPEIEPTVFVHDILTDMKASQVKRTRYVSRLLPVENTCHANMLDIERVGEQVLKRKFHTPESDGTITSRKFAIVARVRNCTKINRLEVIEKLAAIVGKPHQVDLTNPDLTILVEIIQNICMISVVHDFEKLKKYNIESLLGLNITEKTKDGNNKETKRKDEGTQK